MAVLSAATTSGRMRLDAAAGAPATRSGLLRHHDIFRQRLESGAVILFHGDRDVAGLTGVDIPDDAGFAGMGACNHFAGCAIDKTRDSLCCHVSSMPRDAARAFRDTMYSGCCQR